MQPALDAEVACQNWQSAAPPAIVPNKCGLISITFFTVCEEMYGPCDARESTAITTPCSKMKPSVVVPWLGLT